jgi:signal transduction histidine kinase
MTPVRTPDFAHEINQPLNAIRMAAENALDRLRSGPIDPSYIEGKLTVIVEQTMRAAALVRELSANTIPAGQSRGPER